MKSNSVFCPLYLRRRVPTCWFVLACFMWALASAAQAAFTNQPPGAIPPVCDSSVAWGDYDNDGDLDLALTGLDAGDVPISRIYTNNGGFFTAGPSFPGVYLSVVAWGDYDNDGNLDLLLAGATSLTYPYAPICRLYHNRGDGTFENSGAGLPGVYGAAAAWGDYDKDGDLDLVLTGWGDAGRISRLYRNDGAGVFVDVGMGLSAVSYGSMAWGDYDNDGYLDLVLCGSSSSGRITRLYHNSGNGTFSDSGMALTGVTTGSVGWGDYDNDGDLDLFVTGGTSSAPVSQVYTNHGNGVLTGSGMVLIGLASSAGAWADYDNDGDLDLVLIGDSDNGLVSVLYTNHGNGTLTAGDISLPAMATGSVAWGDFDNSGQIDLLLTGFDTNYTAAIYLGRNTATPINRSPAVLTNLTTRLSGRDVNLTWASGSDDHTPGSGLHYNLRLGNFPGGGNRVAPMADAATGYRRVVRLGNGARTNAWTVKGLPDGTYYWSVQAIDGAFVGGAFARETSFTVPSNPPTDISLTPAVVTEGQPVGTVVGKFTASDLNADDTHTFTLVAGPGDADNGLFGVGAEELMTAAVFDFESRSSYQIRVRATDPGGLYFEKPFTITVLDANEPPQARCQDVTLVAGANGTASASVNNDSSDPEDGNAVALSQSPPGPYPAGTNLVTLTATDSRGASNSCVATVIVRDLTPPALSCPASLRLEAAPGECGVALSYYSVVSASDNCDPAPVISSVPPAGTYLPVGRTNVLVTVSDASGNARSAGFIVSVYPAGTEVAGAQWRECQTIAEPEPRGWRAIAASATGVLVGAVNGGRLQVSKDFGATWSERENSRNWSAVAASTNGTKLAAVAFGGQIYVSGDSGETWISREDNRNWSAIACSADGTQLAAAVYGGPIYTSGDAGVSWTPRESSRAWASIACAADGKTIAAVVRNGPIYISADAGASWIARATDTNRLWSSIACSSGGDFMVAAVSGGQIYTSFDYGSTWTPRATDRSWSAVGCAQYSLILAADNGGRLYTSTDTGQTWTNRETDRSWSAVAVSSGSDLLFAAADGGHVYSSRDLGATWDVAAMTRFWISMASSADGAKWVAADNGGQIYTSVDSGTNWVGRATNRWYAVASSADGTKLAASADGGQLYTSADSGATWTARESNRAWHGVASSADGVKLAAVAYGEQIYTSANSGQTWTPRDSSRTWSGVASSADGTKLVATVNGGRIYTSANSGQTWTPRDAVRPWSAVASSAEGTRLVATVTGGRIYTSADSGQTWTPRESNRQWSAIASSAEGTRLAAVESNGLVYLSTDAGLTWRACGSNRNWQTVACSADGMKLAAAVYGGRIYTSLPTISPPTVPSILGATNRVVGGTSVAGTVITFDVTATNTCQPHVPVTCTPPSGSTFPFGTNTVVCVAVDAFDVAVTNSFTVTVVERPEQGGWRQALALDGVDDQVSVTNMTLANGSLTIELWAKRQNVGTWDAFVGQGVASAGQGLFFGFRDDDRVVFSFCEEALLTTNAYTDSAWHHWVATYDPAVGRCLYRDGILVGTDTNTAAYTGTGPLLIGAIPWATDAGFGGTLDDVRIWNEARTAEQIRLDMLHPLTGSNPRLLAYWNFNADTEGAVFDATVNQHTGTVVSSPVSVASSVPPWGYALDFDGVDDYMDLPDGVYFGGDFTIEAWAFPRAYNYWSRILDFGNGTPSDNVLLGLSEQNSGKPSLHVYRGPDSFITAPAPVPTNQWVHLAATLSGNTATLYVNGLPVVSGNVAVPNAVLRTNNYLGRSPWSQDGYLAGLLDEVRIWKVARTAAEIQAGLSRHLTTAEPDLVACWSFDEGRGVDVLDASANLSDGTLVNGPAWVPSTVGRAPAVTTLIAGPVISEGTNAVATLNGLVNPNMGATTCWFEWGATTAYGNRTPKFEIGSGLAAIGCSNVLDGLAPGQTYHHRLVAENAFGIAHGADQVVAPLLVTLRGADPLLVPAGSTFADPGIDIVNPTDLQLGATKMAGGSWHNVVIGRAGTVLAWGLNDSGQATVPGSLGSVVAIAAGGSHSLALSAKGSVVAWGNNNYGQSVVPQNATNVTAVAAGYWHSLALRRDGTVVAWGAGAFSASLPYYGQTMVPASATNMMAIAAGGYHSLALTSNGTVVAWGLNNEGQLNIPATATNVTAIAAGHGHNLALRADGRVVAWGNNIEGQTIVPAAATNIIAIAANGWHSLALKDDGTVVAWGAGTTNTGTGLSLGQCMVPAGTSNVTAVAAGLAHSLAVRADGSMVAWGDNRYGQTQGLSIALGGVVDTRQPGVYTVTYGVNNAFGWATTTTRSVRVVDRPVLRTEPVVNVTSGTVALRSLVTPNGLEALTWFEWGATTNYGGTTSTKSQGEGFEPAACSIELADLTPEATYHYRAVASNSLGAVYGPDSLFTVFSTDAALSALAFGEAIVNPPFAPNQMSYAAIVPNEIGYLIINPISADDGATIRVRVNGGSFSPVVSGTPSVPLFLVNGTNLIQVQVVAQDGVTRQTYGVTVTRELPSGRLVGPYFPPPMGVTFTESGNPNDDQIGRAEGKTWSFSGASLASQTLLFWGATNNGVKLSFNDEVFDTNEIMTYQPALSSLGNGIVVWSGRTVAPPLSNVYTRFLLSVTNSATGTALPLIEAATLGLPANMGALVRVTPSLAWKAVLRFQASFSTNGPFEPALVFFDRNVATNFPDARAYSSFGAGFFHLNAQPVLMANNALAVERGTTGWITPGLLAVSDMETTDPALLRFTIAPQGQGGPPRNGTLSLGATDLAAGDSFTQADLNAARLSYRHSGNCETNDDFTFNVTDQHGGVTPTGEHTTYTFRILIAQPNVPPQALSRSASTGLQAPYKGFLSATNADCEPQILTFRILTLPTKGIVTLDDANTGAFTYTPAAGQQGVDSFKFQVNDGFIDAFDSGTFTITISNQPPVAMAGAVVTRENLSCAANVAATDPDRPVQALTFNIVSNAAKGTVVITNPATGGFVYTPNPGAIGGDSFTFTASDGVLLSRLATFTLTIRPNLDEGDLLVADGGGKQIVLVDPTGAQAVVSAGGLIADPRGIAFDPPGSILLLDSVNGLLRIDPINERQAVISSPTNFSSKPLGAYGIALEPGGAILVADGVNGLVRVNPTNGIPVTLAVSNHLVLPISVALSPAGDVYVGDAAGMLQQSSRIVRVNRNSGAQTLLSSGDHLLLPTGIAFDTSGNLLVTEAPTVFGGSPDLVLCVDSTNGNQTVLTASNLLAGPIGVATASAGTLYVVNMVSGSLISIELATGTQTLFSSGPPLVRPSALAAVHNQAPNLIVGIQRVSGSMELQFLGVAGRSYFLERSVNLLSWQEVTNAAAAADGIARFIDLNPPSGSAFYRVRLP